MEALLARRFHRGKGKFKVSYLSFVLIEMKLFILLQDAHRRRLTKKEASTKIETRMMEKITKEEVMLH